VRVEMILLRSRVLTPSLAFLLYPPRARKAIVPSIARIVITTISSTRVKALRVVLCIYIYISEYNAEIIGEREGKSKL